MQAHATLRHILKEEIEERKAALDELRYDCSLAMRCQIINSGRPLLPANDVDINTAGLAQPQPKAICHAFCICAVLSSRVQRRRRAILPTSCAAPFPGHDQNNQIPAVIYIYIYMLRCKGATYPTWMHVSMQWPGI